MRQIKSLSHLGKQIMVIDKSKRNLMYGLGGAGIGVLALSAANRFSFISKTTFKAASNELRIPPLLDSRNGQNIAIDIQDGKHEFFPGILSQTKGFNGSYLGPTIRMYKGETTKITFNNLLDEPTTIHGHGLHVDGRWDGGPQNIIKPGEKLEYQLNIIQQSGTSWYHPHFMGKTAEHVHAGLAGMYIIEDQNSLSANLPKRYGIDDVPLVLQDRTFINGVIKTYSVTPEQIMQGLQEDSLVVNGTINAYKDVPKGWVRLRLLNGANARYYKLTLDNGGSFYKIATDGGFLNKPVPISELTIAPGERNEIMIDFSDGLDKRLLADFQSPEGEEFFTSLFTSSHSVLEMRVNTQLEPRGSLPVNLNDIRPYNINDVKVTRHFELQMGEGGEEGQSNSSMDTHNMFSINGRSMDMAFINHESKKGQLELWKISGENMRHPFHMHGTSFLILSQNGNEPKPEDQGWKDTVNVDEGVTEVLLKFDVTADSQSPFMYHCHILEHEDAGMMGQFTVL